MSWNSCRCVLLNTHFRILAVHISVFEVYSILLEYIIDRYLVWRMGLTYQTTTGMWVWSDTQHEAEFTGDFDLYEMIICYSYVLNLESLPDTSVALVNSSCIIKRHPEKQQ